MCMFPRLVGGRHRVKGQRSRMVVVRAKERSGVQVRKYEDLQSWVLGGM
jgi:hypothetical protein